MLVAISFGWFADFGGKSLQLFNDDRFIQSDND